MENKIQNIGNQSVILPQQQDCSTLTSKLQFYLNIACERTNGELSNLDSTIIDIQNEFPELREEDFKKALKGGSLGKYGRTYKLSTQEICIWIREYLKENPTLGKTNQKLMTYDD